jgi:hypothetical protein
MQFDEPLVEALEEQRATASVRTRGERYLPPDARGPASAPRRGLRRRWLSRALEPGGSWRPGCRRRSLPRGD